MFPKHNNAFRPTDKQRQTKPPGRAEMGRGRRDEMQALQDKRRPNAAAEEREEEAQEGAVARARIRGVRIRGVGG